MKPDQAQAKPGKGVKTKASDAMREVLAAERSWFIAMGDCREKLRLLPANSIDAVVTDPPAGIEFMGKKWDSFKQEEDYWQTGGGFSKPGIGERTTEWPSFNGVGANATCAKCGGRMRGANRCACSEPEWRVKGKPVAQAQQQIRTSQLLVFQNFIAEVFTEVYRVLKPGGHVVAWALPRTNHHTAMGLERAGFDIRDCGTYLFHLFGQGFPKSLAVDKSIDAKIKTGRSNSVALSLSEKERPIVGSVKRVVSAGRAAANAGEHGVPANMDRWHNYKQAMIPITAPATEEAKRFNGFGTALKPSVEFWLLCRKPLEGTVAENVLKHGTGGINIDGTRIHTAENLNGGAYAKNGQERYDGAENWRFKRTKAPVAKLGRGALPGDQRQGAAAGMFQEGKTAERDFTQPVGRWPAHLALAHTPGCKKVGTKTVKANQSSRPGSGGGYDTTTGYGTYHGVGGVVKPSTADANGNETVEAWECEDGCPIKLLDEQAGTRTSGVPGTRRQAHETTSMSGRPGMTGRQEVGYAGPSRFFYTAKAPSSEKHAVVQCGCTKEAAVKDVPVLPMKEAKAANGQVCAVCGEKKVLHAHPTVKPISLMEWLVTLVTPPGGVVLDPFTGSGTTGVAVRRLGFRFLGIEQDKTYVALSRHRVKHAKSENDE